MAKKFYYQGKNKSANKQGEDKAQAQPQNLDEKAQVKAQKSDKPQGQPQKSDKPQGQPQKGDNKSQRQKGDNRGQNQPKHHKAQPKQNTSAVESIYPKEKMSLALENVGVSPRTAELLAKNKINTVGDVVLRTEKDMFKVQGFNKKMLFELKDALKAQGMEFRPEAPKPQKKEQGPKPTVKADDKPQKKGDKNSKPDKAVKEKAEKPQKLTEPLEVDEWRKIQKGGKWGFYDGFKTVIPAQYDEVFSFHDGLASVELDEKCGYIDMDNNVVIPLEYETAMSFSEGYAAVSKRDKFGYINKENTVVIPFEYDAATVFENGEAKVKKDGKWGTIFPDGTVKWI